MAHSDQPKWTFFWGLHFGHYAVLPSQIFTRVTDWPRLPSPSPKGDGGPPKNSNRENLKFGLILSVWASITSGLVGISSPKFSWRRGELWSTNENVWAQKCSYTVSWRKSIRHVVLEYSFWSRLLALLREEFRISKLTFHSDLRRRAASRLALPCQSSYLLLLGLLIKVIYRTVSKFEVKETWYFHSLNSFQSSVSLVSMYDDAHIRCQRPVLIWWTKFIATSYRINVI